MAKDSILARQSTSAAPASHEPETLIPDDVRVFLCHFPVPHRSTIANWFHHAVRAGATTPPLMIARVRQELLRRLRQSPREAPAALLSQALETLQSDAAGASAYASAVIRWERLPSAERHRQKTARAQHYQREYMATHPPTAKQLAYLATLGYRGELPANRLTASALIEAARRRKGGRQ